MWMQIKVMWVQIKNLTKLFSHASIVTPFRFFIKAVATLLIFIDKLITSCLKHVKTIIGIIAISATYITSLIYDDLQNQRQLNYEKIVFQERIEQIQGKLKQSSELSSSALLLAYSRYYSIKEIKDELDILGNIIPNYLPDDENYDQSMVCRYDKHNGNNSSEMRIIVRRCNNFIDHWSRYRETIRNWNIQAPGLYVKMTGLEYRDLASSYYDLNLKEINCPSLKGDQPGNYKNLSSSYDIHSLFYCAHLRALSARKCLFSSSIKECRENFLNSVENLKSYEEFLLMKIHNFSRSFAGRIKSLHKELKSDVDLFGANLKFDSKNAEKEVSLLEKPLSYLQKYIQCLKFNFLIDDEHSVHEFEFLPNQDSDALPS